MIGSKQFTSQIQHHLKQVSATPFRKAGWRVILMLPDGDKELDSELTISGAVAAGQAYLDKHHKGKHL